MYHTIHAFLISNFEEFSKVTSPKTKLLKVKQEFLNEFESGLSDHSCQLYSWNVVQVDHNSIPSIPPLTHFRGLPRGVGGVAMSLCHIFLLSWCCPNFCKQMTLSFFKVCTNVAVLTFGRCFCFLFLVTVMPLCNSQFHEMRSRFNSTNHLITLWWLLFIRVLHSGCHFVSCLT